MTLKQDERALLQLICERGQSYEDLAGVLGIDAGAVQAKARAALTTLGGADPDAEVSLTDYLLGQADPIGRADAVRYLQQDDEARALAEEIGAKLLVLAPAAELPTIPEPRGRRRPRGTAPAVPETSSADAPPAAGEDRVEAPSLGEAGDEGVGRDSRRVKLLAAAGAGGLLVIFAILALAGVFGGDDDAGASDQQQREQLAEQLGLDPDEITDEDLQAAEEQRDITPVELNAQGGSGVAGAANFGLASDVLFVDLSLSGLDPEPPEGDVYVLWMMLTPGAGYPVSVLEPNGNGAVQDRYTVPTAVAISIGSRARFVQISQSPRRGLQQQINDALERGAPVIPFEGETLARGRIPMAEGAAGAQVPEGTEGAEGAQGEGGQGGGE